MLLVLADPLPCFWSPAVYLVFLDLAPELDLEQQVPVEQVLPVVEVVVVAVPVVVVPQLLSEHGYTQSNPVDELGFLIATRKCPLV